MLLSYSASFRSFVARLTLFFKTLVEDEEGIRRSHLLKVPVAFAML